MTRIASTKRSRGASLSRKPAAPARSAPKTYSSRFDPDGCEPCRGLDPVHPGHADVHQDDVWSKLFRALDRLPTVSRLADDLEP
jgi:hypothetical protein